MQTSDITEPLNKLTQPFCTSDNRIQDLASSYPLLAKIIEPEWIKTISKARSLTTGAKTILFSGSAPCDNFMLILKGVIRIYQTASDGREMTLYRVKAGDLCILSLNSMLQKRGFNAIAETESDVTALILSSEDFRHIMNVSEIFRNYVLTTITEHLCDAMHLIQETTFNHLNMRLACMLGSLFERAQSNILKTTHQELAHELGTTREVVSRILKEFEHQKCINLSRGKIELASATGLEWFSTIKD